MLLGFSVVVISILAEKSFALNLTVANYLVFIHSWQLWNFEWQYLWI